MTARTPAELERECMGVIWRVCDRMARFAEAGDEESVRTWYGFLKAHMRRLEIIGRMNDG